MKIFFSLFSSKFFCSKNCPIFAASNGKNADDGSPHDNLFICLTHAKKKNMETKAFLTTSKAAAINAIATRMNVNNWNDEKVRTLFADFQNLRKEWTPEERKEAAKVFFANFDKLTTAKIKLVTRINENKITKKSEAAKVIANAIFADVDTQRRKVRGMLSNAVERKAQIYQLAYSKSFYLATFDTLTEEEFLSLYKGVATIKVEDVIALLTAKINAKK